MQCVSLSFTWWKLLFTREEKRDLVNCNSMQISKNIPEKYAVVYFIVLTEVHPLVQIPDSASVVMCTWSFRGPETVPFSSTLWTLYFRNRKHYSVGREHAALFMRYSFAPLLPSIKALEAEPKEHDLEYSETMLCLHVDSCIILVNYILVNFKF